MLILEKPYVSDLLIECAERNNLPILRNQMSEKLANKGCNLNLLGNDDFENAYRQSERIYTMSENALDWIYKHLSTTDLVKKIGLLKDKAAFRKICSSIYPDFLYKEVSINELYDLPVSDLKFPLVLKPSVGFLSAGVYVVRSEEDWNNAIADIRTNFEKVSSQFPDFVVGSGKFLIEEYIKGEEFAVDAYFDSNGNPVILNIFHHRFFSETDVSDRLYCMSKNIYDKYLGKFTEFLINLNSLLYLHDFPMHIEFRYDGNRAIPIEINPLRFAGFCLNELQVYVSGIHPVMAYFNDFHPDYNAMWKNKENDVYSFLVLERPASLPENAQLNEEKLRTKFSDILTLRKVEDTSVGVFATMFTRTDSDHLNELDEALVMDMKQFAK